MTIAEKKLNLLSLDGGGIRGLSSLYILRHVMESINPECPPKPCEYFDMIGGTGSGGLIAIMLGRLGMDIVQCIDAYRVLCSQASRVGSGLKAPSRSSNGARLGQALKDILKQYGYDERTLLKDTGSSCKVFTCVTSTEGKHINLASYPTRNCPHDLSSATIWEACLASYASAFGIEPIPIASTGQTYNDSTLAANNPIRRLWAEANTTWPSAPLKTQLGCLVSIGTGASSVLKFNTSVPDLVRTLRKISNETEATANTFIRENTELDDEGRYFRFSVPNGLADIRPDEVGETNTIVDVTQEYVMQELVFKHLRRCARAVGASGKRAFVPVVSAWELPGARRSLDNGNARTENPGGQAIPSGYQPKQTNRVSHHPQPRGKFLGLFGNKKTTVAV